MFAFFRNSFALIGLLFVFLISGGLIMALQPVVQLADKPAKIVLALDFTQTISEQGGVSPFALAMDDNPMVLKDILLALDCASRDSAVKGVVAHFGGVQPSFVHGQEIRGALERFRASGKFSYAFGSDFGEFGLGSRTYYLASAFENIWLQPVGTVGLSGISLRSPFLKGTLDKIGVVADFMQREEYKSFMEMGQREAFSPLVKEEMQGMIDNFSEQIASGVGASRKRDTDQIKLLMDRGPFTDEEAEQEGLVTRLAYADEFDDEIERKVGKDATFLKPGDYLAYIDFAERDRLKTKVALIEGMGIVTDKGLDGNSVMGDTMMGADVIAEAFAAATDDDTIKAILFRVDSPGGSPSASETIRRAVVNAQKKGKPVIVSMGGTAASGGYWVAMNGDRIIANPGTLTGSIGVVAGKFAFDGLLEKIGVTIDGVTTSARAGMWGYAETFTPEQRERLNALLDNTYRRFVTLVSQARNIPMEKMPDVAKGRVFTGEQALKAGLVDALGGYNEALVAVRSALKLGETAPLSLEYFPEPPTPVERFLKLFHRLSMEAPSALSLVGLFSSLREAGAPFVQSLSYAKQPVAVRLQPVERLQ